MKRFHFRAATVLHLRQRQYAIAQTELARAQAERDIAAARVRDAEAAVRGAEDQFRNQLVKGGDAGELQRHRNWITRQHAGAETCRRQLAERLDAVERATAHVRRTHRQSRVLERLRDRAWRDYQAEARREDLIAMDELAVIQYARRMEGDSNGDG
jgi:flagellar export protein FliJ